MATVGVGAVLAALAFGGQGGLLLGRITVVEIALLIGSGVAVAVAAVLAPARGPLHGASAFALFGALGLFTVASITWAAQPSDAWLEANRTLTYVALFAATIALVRVAPDRWGAVLGGVALAGVVVSGWALLTKVFPGALDPDELYARLRAPFSYWNATGLEAGLAIPACLWLGARRHGRPALSALAFPAVGLLTVTVMLAYSRGALLAVVVGVAFWFAVVPLRLRGALVLATGIVGGGLVVAWAFAQDALSQDNVPLAVRTTAGHDFGVALVAMLVLLAIVGLIVGFAEATRPLAALQRRRIGVAILCVLALLPLGLGADLAFSARGFTGSISHAFNVLTDPNARGPSNTPGRLTSAGSVRARYWSEALSVFSAHPTVGVGAGGFATVRPRYRHDLVEVRHAHGYVFQTLADLGWIGLALSLIALVAWAVTAARATGVRVRDRARASAPERVGLLTLVAVVVTFGVHSFVDWTWFVPGTACIAIVCAGWVAGRGPLPGDRDARALVLRPRGWLANRAALAVAVAALVVAFSAAWAAWQPLRSANASDDGLAALGRNDPHGARADALAARDRNPLAIDPLTVLALADACLGDRRAALHDLQQAVVLQPANAQPWLRLADFQLNALRRPRQALRSLSAALYLDPQDPLTIGAYLEAYRRATGRKNVTAAPTAPLAPSPVPSTQPPGTS